MMAYWRVYIVLVKAEGDTIYRPYVGGNGCVVAHETKKAADNCLRLVKMEHKNAYIQKCGAIS
jgi:hypothetical protein